MWNYKPRPIYPPEAYAVYFPEIHVAKIGVSVNRRWKTFLPRGAVHVDSIQFESMSEARQFEATTHADLREIFDRGFQSADAACPFLGIGGGGWTETYSVGTVEELLIALRSVNSGERVGTHAI